MAAKSLDDTRVAFLVCEHQARGRDRAVFSGAATHLWAGSGYMQTLFNFYSVLPSHFEPFLLTQLVIVVLKKPDLVV